MGQMQPTKDLHSYQILSYHPHDQPLQSSVVRKNRLNPTSIPLRQQTICPIFSLYRLSLEDRPRCQRIMAAALSSGL